MSDIRKIAGSDGRDDGERGERGHRGHRGATGPAGPSSGARIGRQVFDVAGPFTYVPTLGTRKAIVRGDGGGGGGGGMDTTALANAAGSSGGNSGIAIEVEITAPPNTLLTGGPGVVGAGGPGGVGSSAGTDGGTSTLVIGGVSLVAPGGFGGNSGGHGFTPPAFVDSSTPVTSPSVVDYQAADLGEAGLAVNATSAIRGGDGGSGDYGIGGKGAFVAGDGFDASGNGAGGGGAAQSQASAIVRTGGAGTDGLWIIEDYS
jgi:hypothetical protein